MISCTVKFAISLLLFGKILNPLNRFLSIHMMFSYTTVAHYINNFSGLFNPVITLGMISSLKEIGEGLIAIGLENDLFLLKSKIENLIPSIRNTSKVISINIDNSIKLNILALVGY